MKRFLFTALLTALSASSLFGVSYQTVWERQIDGADGFVSIDPLLSEYGELNGFIFADSVNNRLLIHYMDQISYRQIDFESNLVDVLHNYSEDRDTLYIYAASTDKDQRPIISLVAISKNHTHRIETKANTFDGIGQPSLTRFELTLIKDKSGQPSALAASITTRFSEAAVGQGTVSEDFSTYLEYSLDLQDEKNREKLSDLVYIDLDGDEFDEQIRSVNYSYLYDYHQSTASGFSGKTGFRSISIKDRYHDEIFNSNSDQGSTRRIFARNFAPWDGHGEIVLFGESIDLMKNHGGTDPHLACYTYESGQIRELWYLEADGADFIYSSQSLNLIAGIKQNDRVIFVDGASGIVYDSALFYESIEATTFFETGSDVTALNLLAHTGNRVIVYRFNWIEETPEVNVTIPVPSTFELHQNHPNPFNSETTISFTNKSTQHLDLIVFNILGQSIATLYSGTAASGDYNFNWNGNDDTGRSQASGMYFAQLKSADNSQMIKLIYLK